MQLTLTDWEWRDREVKGLAQGHTENLQQSQKSILDPLRPTAVPRPPRNPCQLSTACLHAWRVYGRPCVHQETLGILNRTQSTAPRQGKKWGKNQKKRRERPLNRSGLVGVGWGGTERTRRATSGLPPSPHSFSAPTEGILI